VDVAYWEAVLLRQNGGLHNRFHVMVYSMRCPMHDCQRWYIRTCCCSEQLLINRCQYSNLGSACESCVDLSFLLLLLLLLLLVQGLPGGQPQQGLGAAGITHSMPAGEDRYNRHIL
jgi:hypothetical protein